MEFLNQPIESLRLFYRIEVFALQIFDERDFHGLFVWNVLNDDGDAMHRNELSCAPAALAGEQLKTRAAPADDERLDNSGAADRLRQFVESGLSEACPGLIGARVDQVDIDLEGRVGRVGGASGRDCGRSLARRCWRRRASGAIRWRLLRCFGLAYQRAQSPAQRVSGHWR